MPHELVDRWSVLQAYSDALPDIVAQQMDNQDVVISYFEWLQTEAMEGRSIDAVNEHLKNEGKKPLSKQRAAEVQADHVRIATERVSEAKHNKESIERTVKSLQINIELLNLKLLNTKPGTGDGPKLGPVQLSKTV
jgi:hypothetical protein